MTSQVYIGKGVYIAEKTQINVQNSDVIIADSIAGSGNIAISSNQKIVYQNNSSYQNIVILDNFQDKSLPDNINQENSSLTKIISPELYELYIYTYSLQEGNAPEPLPPFQLSYHEKNPSSGLIIVVSNSLSKFFNINENIIIPYYIYSHLPEMPLGSQTLYAYQWATKILDPPKV